VSTSTAAMDTGVATMSLGASRWTTWVTWIAILVPLPYSLSRVLWAAGIPVGISSGGLRDLDSPGWGSLPIVGLALLAEAMAIFVHAFVLSRARTVPAWFPVGRGRPVRPWMVIAVLMLPIAILAYANATTAAWLLGLVDIHQGVSGGGWGVWMTAVVFGVWGPALTAATLAYYRHFRMRGGAGGGTARPPAAAAPPLRLGATHERHYEHGHHRS